MNNVGASSYKTTIRYKVNKQFKLFVLYKNETCHDVDIIDILYSFTVF